MRLSLCSGDACVTSAAGYFSHGTSRSGLGSLEKKCFLRASWLLRLAELVWSQHPAGFLGASPQSVQSSTLIPAVKLLSRVFGKAHTKVESNGEAGFRNACELEQRVQNLVPFHASSAAWEILPRHHCHCVPGRSSWRLLRQRQGRAGWDACAWNLAYGSGCHH